MHALEEGKEGSGRLGDLLRPRSFRLVGQFITGLIVLRLNLPSTWAPCGMRETSSTRADKAKIELYLTLKIDFSSIWEQEKREVGTRKEKKKKRGGEMSSEKRNIPIKPGAGYLKESSSTWDVSQAQRNLVGASDWKLRPREQQQPIFELCPQPKPRTTDSSTVRTSAYLWCSIIHWRKRRNRVWLDLSCIIQMSIVWIQY